MSIGRAARIVAAVALVAGCGPDDSDGAGLNRYATDVVLGAQTKPTTPPPAPMADLAPAFPSFIVPSPPPPDAPSTVVFEPTTTLPPPVARTCRQADVRVVPKPVAADVGPPPATGVYSYRQKGSYKVGEETKGSLPEQAERTVKNLVKQSDGTFSYDVEISQFGTTTTTTYQLVRVPGSVATNGIYISRTVMKLADGSTRAFQPSPPGLQIFPLPAQTATNFRSVATDPLNGTSASLDGAVTAPARVDACGDLVEGWETKATITMTGAARSSTVTAVYVVVPQLGGLIVADQTDLAGTEGGPIAPVPVSQHTEAILNRLQPVRSGPP